MNEASYSWRKKADGCQPSRRVNHEERPEHAHTGVDNTINKTRCRIRDARIAKHYIQLSS